jgi:uroporphyrinogen-III synthase
MNAAAGKRLAGRRVLLTRSAEDCAEWAEKLAGYGAVPIALPCIHTEIADTPALRAELAAGVADADWIVFTSRRGVEAFATLYDGPLGDARVAVVGPVTAETARARLGRVDLVGRGTAELLAGELLASGALNGRPRMLLPLAANADDRLVRALTSAECPCTRLDVYRTFPAPPLTPKRAMSSLGADNVLLASPSAVTGFLNQVEMDAAVAVYSIGPSTSAAARAAGLAVTAEAQTPSLHGILELMLWPKK